jgi:polyhydroxyalkanoate synthesis regulator protein
MQLIKTYANGRFYDTLNKKYIRKEQLADLFNNKEEITDYHAQNRRVT